MLIILFAITSNPVFAIVNGKAEAHTNFSFFVQIMNVYKTGQNGVKAISSCGGSILNKQYIITAAHCVDEESDHITKYVSIGEPSKTKVSIESLKEIEEIHIFEKYGFEKNKHNKGFTVNDLAILKLKNPITENVASVTFSSESYIHSYFTNVIAMGLGRTESPNPKKYLYGHTSEYLRSTEIELMHIEICDKLNIPSSLLCSRNNFNDTGIIKKTAEGDSGSPIVMYDQETEEYHQIGITSSHDLNYNEDWSLSYYHNITKIESIYFISQFENLVEKTTYNPNDKNYYLKSEYEDLNSFFENYDNKIIEYNKILKAKRDEYYASNQYKYDLAIFIFEILINIALIISVFTLFVLIVKMSVEKESSFN